MSSGDQVVERVRIRSTRRKELQIVGLAVIVLVLFLPSPSLLLHLQQGSKTAFIEDLMDHIVCFVLLCFAAYRGVQVQNDHGKSAWNAIELWLAILFMGSLTYHYCHQ